jgi:hypothetical protein
MSGRDGNSALICAEPGEAPVTNPVLAPTVATAVLLLDQLELVVNSYTVPSEKVA